MTESLFTKTFSYRQRENHSPLENYLTEIFAFCVENDWHFRKELFKSLLAIELQKTDVFNISTQKEYDGYGRPDIEITFNDTVILFECKVESGERLNQLKDYTAILIEEKQEFAKKHLIYLTKYFEQKEEPPSNIVTLHPIRWFQIYELISESHSEITKQLKTFLKENNMEKPKNFTIQDLLAMNSISETLSKMDELLAQFKPAFKDKFEGYSKEASRSTQLQNNQYIKS